MHRLKNQALVIALGSAAAGGLVLTGAASASAALAGPAPARAGSPRARSRCPRTTARCWW